MHDMDITHGNIVPANILIDENSKHYFKWGINFL
jgi:serine/threonine protein kinase